MRTSILSTFLLGITVTLISSFALANDALSHSKDSQFEPKSYTVSKPPLYSPAPRVHEVSIKPVPLEVKRTQVKLKKHVMVKHHFVAPKKNVLFANLKRHHRLSQCVVYPGSLKMNVERIAGQYGWHRVVWSLPEDYRWVGKTRIAARNLTGILGKLLQDYPLQAQFYEGNHVLVIVPRTIQ